VIRAEKLSKSFPTSGMVLKEVSLEIPAGQFVSIVGKSGSGKTTLLSLLAALDRPTSGELWWGDKRLDLLSEDELTQIRRDEVGFVFQGYHLIPSLTALENVLVPVELAGKSEQTGRAHDLLERVGLTPRKNHYPKQLSGGEQQRLAICRALVHQPRILFADEPTGNLDSESAEMVMRLLLEMREGVSFVLVTHDLELARLAERKIEISDGVIIQDARPS